MKDQILNLKQNELTNEKINILIDFSVHTYDLLNNVNDKLNLVNDKNLEVLGQVTTNITQIREGQEFVEKNLIDQIEMINSNMDIIKSLNERISMVSGRVNGLSELVQDIMKD